jgi:ribonuclease T1
VNRGRAALGLLLAALALVVGGYLLQPGDAGPGTPPAGQARASAAPVDEETGLPWADLGALPPQVADTVERIDRGGPYRYTQDDTVFGNRERLLPARPSGYYREYTVPTPGSPDRGPRRVVAGDRGDELFYTGDHYASFVRIRR